MSTLSGNEEFRQATEVISNHECLQEGIESRKWTEVVKLMQMLEHDDPFIVYEAAATLQSYIHQHCWHYIIEYLANTGTPYLSIDNSSILEVLHFVLKFVRTQIRSDPLSATQEDLYLNYLKRLCLFLKVPSQRGVAWFDLGQHFSVEHLVVAIDILKLKCAIRSRKTVSDAPPREDVNDIDDLYRLPDIIAPLSNGDIIKISGCMGSDNITLIRKATELIWMNMEETADSTDPETIKLSLEPAKKYLFKAFQSLENANELFATNSTEFFYSKITTDLCIDRETLKRAIKVCLKAFDAAVNMTDYHSDCSMASVTAIEAIVKEISDAIAECCKRFGKSVSAEFFFNICGNEDNDIIYILGILLKLSKSKTKCYKNKDDIEITNLYAEIQAVVDPADSSRGFKHAELFLYFLFRVGLDHTTLLDLLMSQGMQFRDYFSSMLLYIIEDTQDFYESCARAAAHFLLPDEGDEEVYDETAAVDQMVDIVIEIFEELYKLLIMSQESNFSVIIPNLETGITALVKLLDH